MQRWLIEDEGFKAQYDNARPACFTAGMNRIQALTGRAVATLEELLDLKDAPSVRFGAARTVAEMAIHLNVGEAGEDRADVSVGLHGASVFGRPGWSIYADDSRSAESEKRERLWADWLRPAW